MGIKVAAADARRDDVGAEPLVTVYVASGSAG